MNLLIEWHQHVHFLLNLNDFIDDDNYPWLWRASSRLLPGSTFLTNFLLFICKASSFMREMTWRKAFPYIFTCFLDIWCEWEGWKASCVMSVWRNHQIEINKGFFSSSEFFPLASLFLWSGNIKAHMAHSPLNWWDFFFLSFMEADFLVSRLLLKENPMLGPKAFPERKKWKQQPEERKSLPTESM